MGGRFEPNYEMDFKASEKDDFRDVVARRPVVKIMDFIDYDHDGRRSEFYLKTDTWKRLSNFTGRVKGSTASGAAFLAPDTRNSAQLVRSRFDRRCLHEDRFTALTRSPVRRPLCAERSLSSFSDLGVN